MVNATLTDIHITPPNVLLSVGHTEHLTVQGHYDDGINRDITDQVVWSVPDSKIAGVDNVGVLTAKAVGKMTISASFQGVSSSNSVSVEVDDTPVKSLSIQSSSLTLPVGVKKTFTVIATYADNTTRDISKFVNWRSSNQAVATITSQGELTALAAGTTNIQTSIDGVQASKAVKVTVSGAQLTQINVSPNQSILKVGNTEQLVAQGVYSDGTSHDISSQVTWYSNDSNTINVNPKTGVATAVKAGSADVTAQLNGIKSTNAATISVTSVQLTKIEITPSTSSLVVGHKESLKATGVYNDKTTQDISAQVHWRVVDPLVAHLTPTGDLEGLKKGTTDVTAEYQNVKATPATVTVSDAKLTSIQISPSSPTTLVVHHQQSYRALGNYDDGTQKDITKTVHWGASNPALVAIALDGKLTATAKGGPITITANLGGVMSNTAEVTVIEPPLTGVSVTPAQLSMVANSVEVLTAQTQHADHSVDADVTSNPLTHWVSDDHNIAEVNPQGKIIAHAAGSTKIRALYDGTKSNDVDVTVTEPALERIVILSNTANPLLVGTKLPLRAQAIYDDGQTRPADLTHFDWTVDDSTLADVLNATEELEGKAAGTVNLTITSKTDPSIKASAAIQVQAPTLVSLKLTPKPDPAKPFVVKVGVPESFKVAAIYSDGSSRDVTQNSFWATNNGNVNVEGFGSPQAGTVTGTKVGSADISVQFKTQSLTFKVDVQGQPVLQSLEFRTPSIPVALTSVDIEAGSFKTLEVFGVYDDGSKKDITNSTKWKSSDLSIASAEINRSQVVLLPNKLGQTSFDVSVPNAPGVTATLDVKIVSSPSGAISCTYNMLTGSTFTQQQLNPMTGVRVIVNGGSTANVRARVRFQWYYISPFPDTNTGAPFTVYQNESTEFDFYTSKYYTYNRKSNIYTSPSFPDGSPGYLIQGSSSWDSGNFDITSADPLDFATQVQFVLQDRGGVSLH